MESLQNQVSPASTNKTEIKVFTVDEVVSNVSQSYKNKQSDVKPRILLLANRHRSSLNHSSTLLNKLAHVFSVISTANPGCSAATILKIVNLLLITLQEGTWCFSGYLIEILT